MNKSHFGYIVKLAVKSRVVVLLLQSLFDLTIPNHKADAFHNELYENESQFSVLDIFVKTFLSGLTTWDGQYFLQIAYSGYSEESFLAFFPLFPAILRIIGSCIYYLGCGYLNFYSSLILSGILSNILFFSLATFSLFKLATHYFEEEFAFRVIKWFTYNPASIFFTACYSESLFAFLTFTSLWCLEEGNFLLTSLFIGISCLARSNGLITIGFVVQKVASKFILLKKSASNFTWFCLKLVLYLLLCLTPFIVFQILVYQKFCLPLFKFSWCEKRIPLSYSEVQSKYWGVGFFRYYQFKQIPNFILAAPIICLVFFTLKKYTEFYFERKDQNNLNSFKHFVTKLLGLNISCKKQKTKCLYDNTSCYVLVIHCTALAVFCMFFIHIQVTTRLIASTSPVIYFSMASMKRGSKELKLFTLWFYLYFVLGTICHPNFLPWT